MNILIYNVQVKNWEYHYDKQKESEKRYLQEGASGLVSRKLGRQSNRKIPQEIRDKALDLITKNYADFGPTLASEKLRERDGIKVSEETIRKWLTEEGVWYPKKRKALRVYQRRQRRSRYGELLQGDRSPHDWFEGRAESCTLLQFVDDATSETTAAWFTPAETTEGYLELLQEHLEKHGRPLKVTKMASVVTRKTCGDLFESHKEKKNLLRASGYFIFSR